MQRNSTRPVRSHCYAAVAIAVCCLGLTIGLSGAARGDEAVPEVPLAEILPEPATAAKAGTALADRGTSLPPQDAATGEAAFARERDRRAIREAIRDDPLFREIIREETELAVARRLAGIPRPRYIPVSDYAAPKGFEVYAARNGSDFPAALYLNGFLQVRWFEFARSVTSWSPTAPIPPNPSPVEPVENINTFEINRFFITSEGYVADERLLYSITLFGTTDYGNNSAITPLGYVGWKFNDQLTMLGGVTFVAGTREWTTSSRWVMGVDRSMANTFFRPSYSPGVEFNGNFLDGQLNWRGGVWNAIDGSLAGVNRSGTAMAWAGLLTWEPLGKFGLGYSDMEVHRDPAVRLGCSGVHALSQAVLQTNGNNPEDTIVRLSDGTPIAVPDALGPGTQVDQFRLQLASVDAGWKYRGMALNFEYYFRLIDDITGTGQFLRQSLFDQGGLGYLSFCIVPRRYEIYGRSSAVTGDYGTGQEYGGGFNWYLKDSRQGKLTLEALYYNRSPADNTIYPYRAGFSGTAIQTQLLVMW